MPSAADHASVPDGRTSRWTGQQERRRRQFVEAALVAIAEHGADVSTEQIAARAGVARTRLYRHFAGAQELNEAIAARAEEMVLAALEPVWNPQGSPAQMIRTAVSTHLTWLTEHLELYRYLTRHAVRTAGGQDVVADVKGLISSHLMNLIDGYIVLLELDSDLSQPLSFGLVGFVDAAASRWVEDPQGHTLEEMVDLLSGWIWSIIDDALRTEGIELDPDVPLEALVS